MRLWGNVIGTVVRVANEHDRLWRQRRRVLNTLLVTLFVFRLVFSKDRQGYATTVAELWEQCRMMGIALPQATPVAASAMCRAPIWVLGMPSVPTLTPFRIASDLSLLPPQLFHVSLNVLGDFLDFLCHSRLQSKFPVQRCRQRNQEVGCRRCLN